MRGAKKAVATFLGGAIMVTSAWAGASLVPAGNEAPAVPQAAPAASKPAAVTNVDFIVADGTEPASLDPAPGTGPFQSALNPIYDGLTAWIFSTTAARSAAGNSAMRFFRRSLFRTLAS